MVQKSCPSGAPARAAAPCNAEMPGEHCNVDAPRGIGKPALSISSNTSVAIA